MFVNISPIMNENSARAIIMIKNIERCLILFKTAICSKYYFFNIVDENTNFFEIMKGEKNIIQSNFLIYYS